MSGFDVAEGVISVSGWGVVNGGGLGRRSRSGASGTTVYTAGTEVRQIAAAIISRDYWVIMERG